MPRPLAAPSATTTAELCEEDGESVLCHHPRISTPPIQPANHGAADSVEETREESTLNHHPPSCPTKMPNQPFATTRGSARHHCRRFSRLTTAPPIPSADHSVADSVEETSAQSALEVYPLATSRSPPRRCSAQFQLLAAIWDDGEKKVR
jgi:hypothetical protein